MIACIIIVSLALVWLLYETDLLRVNLMGTTSHLEPETPVKVIPEYKPSVFTPCELVDTQGQVYIPNVRE